MRRQTVLTSPRWTHTQSELSGLPEWVETWQEKERKTQQVGLKPKESQGQAFKNWNVTPAFSGPIFLPLFKITLRLHSTLKDTQIVSFPGVQLILTSNLCKDGEKGPRTTGLVAPSQ